MGNEAVEPLPKLNDIGGGGGYGFIGKTVDVFVNDTDIRAFLGHKRDRTKPKAL